MDILFSEKLIRKRIVEIADQISSDYKDREVLIIGVLNGSFIFCADMVRNLMNVKFKMDFISLSSYLGTRSTGKVEVISKFKENVTGKDVLILDDVIETGMTLDFIIKEVTSKKPKSVKTCVLIDKRCMRKKDVPVEYICLEMAANMGHDFVVGYGLDYNGFFRGLPYISKLKEFVR
ncbi:MAG: hypoxanthine phosphoribosyltransferase [Endomicrobium sp.]|jgi:hypoxanthine phosphoribosyltransferase|nr:hypoxanthine phosphoribosyltransferase [Endomicrobium sp.]